jgi:hypothetical protein
VILAASDGGARWSRTTAGGWIARAPVGSPAYHQAFHDITTGNSTVMVAPSAVAGYQAGPGWDPVTGWGTPGAQTMVPLLAGYACH